MPPVAPPPPSPEVAYAILWGLLRQYERRVWARENANAMQEAA
jgi:hypothetical protein